MWKTKLWSEIRLAIYILVGGISFAYTYAFNDRTTTSIVIIGWIVAILELVVKTNERETNMDYLVIKNMLSPSYLCNNAESGKSMEKHFYWGSKKDPFVLLFVNPETAEDVIQTAEINGKPILKDGFDRNVEIRPCRLIIDEIHDD